MVSFSVLVELPILPLTCSVIHNESTEVGTYLLGNKHETIACISNYYVLPSLQCMCNCLKLPTEL